MKCTQRSRLHLHLSGSQQPLSPGRTPLGARRPGCKKPVCCEMPGNGLQSSDVFLLSKFITAQSSNAGKYGLDFIADVSQSPCLWVLEDRPLSVGRAGERSQTKRGTEASCTGLLLRKMLASPTPYWPSAEAHPTVVVLSQHVTRLAEAFLSAFPGK